MKIKDIFNYPPLKRLSILDLNQIKKLYNEKFVNKFPITNGSTLIGIEVEVENVRHPPPVPLWTPTTDGSLRNNGVEYITKPIAASNAEMALNFLFAALPIDADFSKRTSIHVHMNIRNMDVEEVKSLIVLYLIFEKAFFKFVGEDRGKNIHCVPILDTKFVTYLNAFSEHGNIGSIPWMKYTALNILPTIVETKGTIEFRHMHGTRDLTKMMVWLNLILSLKTYAQKYTYLEIQEQIYELNTNSQYRQFTYEVFDSFSENLITETYYGEFEKNIEDSILQVKTCLSSQVFYNSLLEIIKTNNGFVQTETRLELQPLGFNF